MIGFLDRHHIKPVIDSSFSFEALPDALRYLESGRHVGKIVGMV